MNPIGSLPAAGLTPIQAPSLTLSKVSPQQDGRLFEDFFAAALDMYKETNANSIASEQLYIDLATGKTDDILAVVMAQERANASINFTTQITARMIEAFREVMRIQV